MTAAPTPHAELASATRLERGLDVAAAVLSLVPWLGGPVSQVLSGMSIERKMERVKEVLDGLAQDLGEFHSEASEEYVRSGEFQDILEQTLRQVADERNEEKRHAYRLFLRGTIEHPGGPYDEQRRFLRILEQIQGDHIRIMKAMLQQPEANVGTMGSPIQTLRRRLPDMPQALIADLVGQLNDMRLTNVTSLNVMMTAHGAANLHHAFTSYGLRFIAYL